LIDEGWAERIGQLVQPPAEKLLATSVFEIITAEGFAGSYATVVRHMRELRSPRFRGAPAVSVPIETAPAEECQFDFSDCSDWTERWGLCEVWCFGCILCWSRWRLWWFTSSVDREHTFEGLVRFFEAVGGVPKVGRTDRMGALGCRRANDSGCTRRRSTSPAITGSRSRRARPGTPEARASRSARSGTSRKAS
jgi:hypothetical protein